MKAKLGNAPIAWSNDDLEELSDDVSLQECLRQASVAGSPGWKQAPLSYGYGPTGTASTAAQYAVLRWLVPPATSLKEIGTWKKTRIAETI